jgi:hypothetical protein
VAVAEGRGLAVTVGLRVALPDGRGLGLAVSRAVEEREALTAVDAAYEREAVRDAAANAGQWNVASPMPAYVSVVICATQLNISAWVAGYCPANTQPSNLKGVVTVASDPQTNHDSVAEMTQESIWCPTPSHQKSHALSLFATALPKRIAGALELLLEKSVTPLQFRTFKNDASVRPATLPLTAESSSTQPMYLTRQSVKLTRESESAASATSAMPPNESDAAVPPSRTVVAAQARAAPGA